MNSFIASFALIGVCCLILNTSGIEVKESVPVLIWNDEKPPIDTPAISTLPVPFAHLQDKYLQPFKPDNILLFLQDTLSIEDLSSYEGVFKHVSKFMEKSHSLYLPAVEAKSSIAHSLSAHGNNIVTLEPGSSKGELKLKTDFKNLVLVKLPSTITNPSRRKALQKTDEIIGNVLSKIGKKAKFTVIFTGKEPSIKFENEIERRRVSRSLKQNEIDDPHFYHTTCVNLYLWSDMAIEDVNKTAVTLPVNDTIAKSDCQANTASLTIRYKNVTYYGKLGVKFNFIKKRRSWTLRDAEFEITESDTKVFLLPEKQMYDIPLNKSYSCSQKLVFRSNSTVGKPVYKLIIKGVQVEAFTKGQWRFSNNWDCVGFFTIPIWMGIIAGVLLTFIFLVGMFMVSEIKTMDRFDDPKGKHIMVTGANE